MSAIVCLKVNDYIELVNIHANFSVFFLGFSLASGGDDSCICVTKLIVDGNNLEVISRQTFIILSKTVTLILVQGYLKKVSKKFPTHFRGYVLKQKRFPNGDSLELICAEQRFFQRYQFEMFTQVS